MQNMPSYEELDALFLVLRSVVMDPAFQSVVAEIESLPPSERLQEAFRRLTPEALNALGIQMDEQFTFTTFAVQGSTALNTGNEDPAATGQNMVLGYKIPCNYSASLELFSREVVERRQIG